MTILPYSPLFDWSLVPECGPAPHQPGRRPIPKAPMSKPSSFRFVKATRPTSAILTKKYVVPYNPMFSFCSYVKEGLSYLSKAGEPFLDFQAQSAGFGPLPN